MRFRILPLLVLFVLVACGTPTDNTASQQDSGGTDGTAAHASTNAAAGAGASSAAGSQAATGDDPAARDGKYPSAPAMTIDLNKSYTATIETTAGTMKADLYPKESPVAVNNFIFLARENFYKNVKFHRIIQGFMVQTGDPAGTGRGGPGYEFEIEKPKQPEPYKLGMIAMANNSQTNGSQFFINNTPDINQKLSPDYSILGQVTEGLDVLGKISSTPVMEDARGENSMPTQDVLITNITIEEQ